MVSIKIRPSKKPKVAPAPKVDPVSVDFSQPWAIWLDDERPIPANSGFKFVAAKNPHEFVKLIEAHGVPEFISFDWHLGGGWDNGEGVIKWLIESDQLGEHSFPEDFLFDVHSSDHTKNRAMNALLSDYLASKRNMKYFQPRSPKSP